MNDLTNKIELMKLKVDILKIRLDDHKTMHAMPEGIKAQLEVLLTETSRELVNVEGKLKGAKDGDEYTGDH